MIAAAKIAKAAEYIDKARAVCLICHVNPDGDTVSSALALFSLLQKKGKEVAVFCDNKIPEKFAFLQNFDKFNISSLKKFDLAIAVDCADEGRTGTMYRYVKKAISTLSVDHHKPDRAFGDYILNDTSAAATAEIVYRIIRYFEKADGKTYMDDSIAAALFCGIITDSGAFSFSNTTEETLAIASELKRYSFDASGMIYDMISAKSKKVFELSASVLSRCKFYEDDRIGVITFRKSDFAATATTSEDTEGIINNVINVKGVLIAVAVTEEYDKSFKISIRTKAPVDASSVASAFGGGGHVRAAGCRLSGYYEDVLDKILKSARDNL